MQSDSSGSGKRSLTEKFEHYFGKSVSIKVAICLGLTISFLAALLMIALFMNVFTPGSVADAQANISANGSSSLPANSSMTGVNDTDQMANSTKDSLEAVEEGIPRIAPRDQLNDVAAFLNKYFVVFEAKFFGKPDCLALPILE